MPSTYSAYSPDLADNPSVEEVAEQLGHAVYHDDAVTVRRLLAAGADPNGVDEIDIPFMDTAVWRCSSRALRALVEYGGRLDGAADGGSPLLYNLVAGCDLPAMLPVLLELGADVRRSLNSHGWTALHVAAAYATSAPQGSCWTRVRIRPPGHPMGSRQPRWPRPTVITTSWRSSTFHEVPESIREEPGWVRRGCKSGS
jgi:hypothetical protein